MAMPTLELTWDQMDSLALKILKHDLEAMDHLEVCPDVLEAYKTLIDWYKSPLEEDE